MKTSEMYRVLLFSVVITIPYNSVNCIVSKIKMLKEQLQRLASPWRIMFVQESQSHRSAVVRRARHNVFRGGSVSLIRSGIFFYAIFRS